KKLAKTMANWLISELFKYLNKDKKSIREIKITPENFAELILLIYQGKVNSTAGQQILAVMYEQSGDPTDIMSDLGLEQIDDEAALAAIIQDILKKNEAQADQYRAGKNNVLQYLIGQTMAATKGKANPKIIEKILIKFLS
ncbi:Asp-tRNA(Asn)/Glu-tRNA(Gln) amidotransferase GatCAB subunit B, partial [Candidatus Falkowbacteria bacterium CG_4_10_14_0_2_um_filter_48_10]